MEHKVSCLIVTQPERETLLKESLISLSKQTVPVEAVIVVQDDVFGADVEKECKNLNLDFKIVEAAPRITLGELRNISVEAASHDIWCQWDDDDLSMPHRIESQVKAMVEPYHFNFLTSQLYLFTEKRRLFIRDCNMAIHGTVLCKKNRIRYPSLRKSEDTQFYYDAMRYPDRVSTLDDFTLYLRRYHGDNTWDEQFHVNLLVKKGMSTENVLANKEKIIAACAELGVSDVQVWSRNKRVFDL